MQRITSSSGALVRFTEKGGAGGQLRVRTPVEPSLVRMARSTNKRAPNELVLAGAAIRRHRLEAGLSQEALADAAGIHRNYMGYIERGERNASLSKLIQIARALGMGLDTLLAGIPSPSEQLSQRFRLRAFESVGRKYG